MKLFFHTCTDFPFLPHFGVDEDTVSNGFGSVEDLSEIHPDKNRQLARTKSGRVDVPQSSESAYIPLHVAQKHIAAVTRAMKAMKNRHVAIVRDLDGTYRELEGYSQQQFIVFVNTLREDCNSRVATLARALKMVHGKFQQNVTAAKNQAENFSSKLQELEASNIVLLNRQLELHVHIIKFVSIII